MVEVVFCKDASGRYSSLRACGHALWAARGDDVVCAAVSALLQAAWLGLKEVAGAAVDARRREGKLRLSWSEPTDGVAADAIVRTTLLSLQRMARQYPSHLHVGVTIDAVTPSGVANGRK